MALPGAPALDTSGASTYTDINALAALKRDPNSPQAISAVAEQVEALFLQMMLKSMRDASAALETESNEMGMYQDMFDKQVALSISQHMDFGIGRLLKRQLAPTASAPAALNGAGTAAPTPTAPTPAQFVERMMPPIRRAANSSAGTRPSPTRRASSPWPNRAPSSSSSPPSSPSRR